MRVTPTPSAERDLEDIETYIAQDNSAAAIDTVLRVLGSVQSLGEHSEMGHEGRVRNTREWVIDGTPFIAAYRVRGNSVEILRVLHDARKWPTRM